MNLRPLYWVGLLVLIVLAGSLVLRPLPVPKQQPIFRQIPAQHVAYIHYQGAYEDMSLLFTALAKEATQGKAKQPKPSKRAEICVGFSGG